MTCFDCQQQPAPGGLRYAERSAVGICRRCGKGLCQHHGTWAGATREFLCGACAAPRAASPHGED